MGHRVYESFILIIISGRDNVTKFVILHLLVTVDDRLFKFLHRAYKSITTAFVDKNI